MIASSSSSSSFFFFLSPSDVASFQRGRHDTCDCKLPPRHNHCEDCENLSRPYAKLLRPIIITESWRHAGAGAPSVRPRAAVPRVAWSVSTTAGASSGTAQLSPAVPFRRLRSCPPPVTRRRRTPPAGLGSHSRRRRAAAGWLDRQKRRKIRRGPLRSVRRHGTALKEPRRPAGQVARLVDLVLPDFCLHRCSCAPGVQLLNIPETMKTTRKKKGVDTFWHNSCSF